MITTYGFNQLVPYLGGWGTTILATMFFIIVIRIVIAFVFKFFRMNLDYKKLYHRTFKK